MIHKTERQVVQLALAIAARIVHREVALDQELLVGDGARRARSARRSGVGDHPAASRGLRRRRRRPPGRQVGGPDRRRCERQPRRLPRAVRLRPDRRRRRRAVGARSRTALLGGRGAGMEAEAVVCLSAELLARLRTSIASATSSRRRSAAASSASSAWWSNRSARARASAKCASCGAATDAPPLPVEVVGFRDGRLLSVPLGDTAGIRPGDRIVARGGVAVDSGRRSRCSAASSTGSAGRSTASGPLQVHAQAPLKPSALNPLVARSDRRADRHRRAGDRRPADLRTRPAHRPVRRQRRRQEHAARHDGARHRGRCRRARAGRRARPRSPHVPRARSRAAGARAIGGRRVDVGQSAAAAPARGVRRHRHRRALPRPRARTSC